MSIFRRYLLIAAAAAAIYAFTILRYFHFRHLPVAMLIMFAAEIATFMFLSSAPLMSGRFDFRAISACFVFFVFI